MSPVACSGSDATVSDESLVVRAKQGDRSAFSELVARHRDEVYGLALRMCSDATEAEEVSQDTFLSAFDKLHSFRGEARFATWLHRIAANAALMRRRATRRHCPESLETFLPDFDDRGTLRRLDLDYGAAGRADEILERAELASKALEAVGRLPEIYRATFVLRDLEELSTEETAETLHLEPSVVRLRLHRARLMMRGYLGSLTGGEK